MRKRLVRKTFDMMQDLADSENKEDYKKFWENFGKFVKLGCIEDSGNHKRITPPLRFYSSKSEEDLISLDDYVENMGENQKAIYYLATDSLKSAKTAPFLEKLVQKDIEVTRSVDTEHGQLSPQERKNVEAIVKARGSAVKMTSDKWCIEKRAPLRNDSVIKEENVPQIGCLSIVVLGASGDLAKKKTFPKLFNLYRQGFLQSHEVYIFDYARTKISDEELRDLDILNQERMLWRDIKKM